MLPPFKHQMLQTPIAKASATVSKSDSDAIPDIHDMHCMLAKSVNCNTALLACCTIHEFSELELASIEGVSDFVAVLSDAV